MNKLAAAIVVGVLLWTPLAENAESAESILQTTPFRDIGAIGVLVEQIEDEDAKRSGLSEAGLTASVELKLRQNGIPVRDMTPWTLESPYLYVNVTLVPIDEIKHFTYNVDISLNQQVRLLRNNSVLNAATWDRSYTGISRVDKTGVKVKEKLDELLTFFLNDYFAANPKKN